MTLAKSLVLLCAASAVLAGPSVDTRNARNAIQHEDNLLDSTYQDCLQKDTFSCLKYKVLSFANKVIGVNEIDVTDGIQIVKSGDVNAVESSRALSNDASIESIVLNKVQTFLETHTLKIDLSGKDLARSLSNDDDDEEESIEEGRGKKGGKKKLKKIQKTLGPYMSIFGLKALFLAKIALIGIALLAKKALIMGKIALLISGFIAVRKLFGNKGGIGGSHPIHTESHVYSHETLHPVSADHGHSYGGSASGGWGRSAQELAYSAYTQDESQQ